MYSKPDWGILNKSSPINTDLALVIHKSPIRSTLTYAALAWGHVATVYFNRLQISRNKVLRTIPKLLGAMPTVTLHQQAATETVRSYVTRIASKFYFTNQSGDNEHTIQYNQVSSTPLVINTKCLAPCGQADLIQESWFLIKIYAYKWDIINKYTLLIISHNNYDFVRFYTYKMKIYQ